MELIKNGAGIYLVGQTSFNPLTDEKFYLIKVGSTLTDLKTRMRGYYTHNPSVWIIETRNYLEKHVIERENYFQEIVAKISSHKDVKIIDNIAYNRNVEWFCVSKKEYLNICNKGFDYLLEYKNKKMLDN